MEDSGASALSSGALVKWSKTLFVLWPLFPSFSHSSFNQYHDLHDDDRLYSGVPVSWESHETNQQHFQITYCIYVLPKYQKKKKNLVLDPFRIGIIV